MSNFSGRSTVKSFSDGGDTNRVLRILEPGDGGGRFFDGDGQKRAPGDTQYSHAGIGSFAEIGYTLRGAERVVSPYLENVFVRSAIKAISSGINRLEFGIWNGDPNVEGTAPIENPLTDLLAKPNRYQTGKQFWQAHTTAMKLVGESFWFLAGLGGAPVRSLVGGMITSDPKQIIQVSGDRVQVNYDDKGFPVSATYAIRGERATSQEFPWSSLVHFRDFNPDDPMRGLGDAEAAIRQIDLQHQILRYLDASLQNSGKPSGMLIFPEAISAAELARRQAEVDDDMSIENAGRVQVVDRDAKFVPNSFTPKDFEYEALWDGMTSAILTSMGVPEPVVGIFEHATYENVKTAYIEFWRGSNGVLALGGSTADVLTNDLIPRLVRQWPDLSGSVAYFDPASIEALAEDFSDEIKLAAEISRGGTAMSFNEILEMLGSKKRLPESGKRHFIAQGLTDSDTGKLYGTPPVKTGSADVKQAMAAAIDEMLEDKNEIQ